MQSTRRKSDLDQRGPSKLQLTEIGASVSEQAREKSPMQQTISSDDPGMHHPIPEPYSVINTCC